MSNIDFDIDAFLDRPLTARLASFGRHGAGLGHPGGMNPVEVVIGRRGGDHVRIEVQGRMHAGAHDYWDGNWLTTPISLRVGSFSGALGADLRADEFRRFKQELQTLYDTLAGTATLVSLDGWIYVTVECQPNGALAVQGVANDNPGIGNELQFSVAGLDQSDVPPLVAALQACEEAFPVIGRSDDG